MSGTTTVNTGTLALTGNGGRSRRAGWSPNGVRYIEDQRNSLAGAEPCRHRHRHAGLQGPDHHQQAGYVRGRDRRHRRAASRRRRTRRCPPRRPIAARLRSRSGTLAMTGNGDIAASSQVIADGVLSIRRPRRRRLQHPAAVGHRQRRSRRQDADDPRMLTADTFAGVIGGSGGLTIAAGTQTLSGINSYSGQS